jgi:hypothetical protein
VAGQDSSYRAQACRSRQRLSILPRSRPDIGLVTEDMKLEALISSTVENYLPWLKKKVLLCAT